MAIERNTSGSARPRSSRHRAGLTTLALGLDRGAPEALHRQLYAQLRDVILSGRAAPGALLPSTRSLMRELALSRTTVLSAFDQLRAEGYIEGRTGAGTYVASVLPDALLAVRRAAGPAPRAQEAPPVTRGVAALGPRAAPAGDTAPRPFRPGVPETRSFPWAPWSRLQARFWRAPSPAALYAASPAGHPGLRAAIADYLVSVRALECTPEQVIITSGAVNALDLVSRVLLEPGDKVWVEDPGYPRMRVPLRAARARLVPIGVDGDGACIAEGLRRAPDARLALLTPARHYPLGYTLSLARRLALLDWARQRGAWVVEDDYDSEYRYTGHPVAALQGLDEHRRVIYMGSFSKVLFPALRVAYLVVSPALAQQCLRLRTAFDDQPSIGLQGVLTEFIESGLFAAHVRRMRGLYAARQAALLAALDEHLGGVLETRPEPAGMHLLARLTARASRTLGGDLAASRRALEAGVVTPALSEYALSSGATPEGLLLGYAGFDAGETRAATAILARALGA